MQKQQGAALIIALVILLIMNVIGVTAANMTVIEERMAGHYLNKHGSFDAAEAALRDGEDVSDAFALYAPTDGTAGLYVPNTGNDPRWEAAATTWQTRAASTIPGVAQQPQYISEYMGGVPRDENCLLDAEASTTQDCWRYAYRVTAQGWGANTNATSVTQSTILSRK